MLLFISISNKFSNKSLHISFIISYIQKFSILSKKNIKTETNQKQKRIQSSYLHINYILTIVINWNETIIIVIQYQMKYQFQKSITSKHISLITHLFQTSFVFPYIQYQPLHPFIQRYTKPFQHLII